MGANRSGSSTSPSPPSGGAGAPGEGYRPEIDGLRGIAVLAVVLFHARVPGFSGGFVGVDVFFVVSGFLITGLVQKETAAGDFSLRGFYERRARRILPALFALLAFTSVASLALLPADTERTAKSLVAVTAFSSNLLFQRWTGYFADSVRGIPLLHTWSLSVEEQFYVTFPALLAFLSLRRRRSVVPLVASFALASFAWGAWATARSPGTAFYSPLARAWELMLGALLAAGAVRPPSRREAGDALAVLGLATLALATGLLTESSPFPGVAALTPCLGTAAVLLGTGAPGSRAALLLGARPLVATGLASYSLYLWHWPLIVLGTYYVLDPGRAPLATVLLALLAFPVAWASWRFVETPFRGPGALLSRRAFFGAAAGISAAFALAGLAGWALDGLPGRFGPTVRRLAAPQPVPVYPCVNATLEEIAAGRLCRVGDPTARPRFALWGDSHAGVFHAALDELARRHGAAGYSLTALGCLPLLDLGGGDPRTRACRDRNHIVLRALEAARPDVVFLAANWRSHLGAAGPARDPDDSAPASTGRKHGPGFSPGAIRSALEETATALRAAGARVYFVKTVPMQPFVSRDLPAKAFLLGRALSIGSSAADVLRQSAPEEELVSDLARRGLVTVVSPGSLLCDARGCRASDDAGPLYFDRHHLNERGARLAAPAFEPILASLGR